MKRVYIIHRWDGNPQVDWYPWLKKELEKKGFEVFVPEMPEPSHPQIDKWVSHLSKVIKNPDEDTYFVGHSIGCQTILRFLEKSNKNIGSAVLVAGWFVLHPLETKKEKETVGPWLKTPIDFEKVKKTTKNFVAIFSENDPYVPLENVKLFKEKLGAKTILEKDKGHFTEFDGVKEIPAVLEELLKITFPATKSKKTKDLINS